MAACWISSLVAREAAAESGQTDWFLEEVNRIRQLRSEGHLAHASPYMSYIQLDRMLAVIASAEGDGSLCRKESMRLVIAKLLLE